MKKILPVFIFFLVFLPLKSMAQWPFSQNAVFLSVSGKVTVVDAKGTVRAGEKDSEAFPGETIKVADNSGAILRFFDGSIVELKSKTQFMIAALEHPMGTQKELNFTLVSGWVTAKVQKLLTSSSLFEIEAGGVVCGVRGTEFLVAYEPSLEKVGLKVMEGTVYAKTGGQTHLLKAGEEIEFNHGQPNSRLYQGTKSAMEEVRDKVTGGKMAEITPLSLRDLNSQFLVGISVNGNGLVADPTVSGPVQSRFHLSLGTQSLLRG
jgi:hypothetical protein